MSNQGEGQIASTGTSDASPGEATTAELSASAVRTGIYRGWPIAGVAFLSTGLAVGMAQYAFGAFVEPLEEEFGWTRTQINFSLTLGLVTGFLSPIVGRWMDRFGARPVMVISLLFLAAGFLLRSVMTNAGNVTINASPDLIFWQPDLHFTFLTQFYLFSLLLFMGFPGATVMPAGRLISVWFARTRGRMMGIVTAGNNFGGLTMVPLGTLVIATAGWRWGYAVYGFIIIGIAVSAWYFIKDRPEDVAREGNKRWAPPGMDAAMAAAAAAGYSARDALRTRSFYFITLGLTAAMFTYSAVLTQLIPHMEAEGFSKNEAAAGISIVAAFGIISKLAFGRISETITARWSTVLSLSIQSAGLVLFIVADGTNLAWVAVAVFGLGFGGIGALIPLTVAEAFGVRHFGSILGIISMFGVVPVVIGPLMAGIIFDKTDSYDLAFEITIGMFLTGAIFMSLAGPPKSPTPEPVRASA
ncbi:MAG: MFS transporter [Chloroflexi bacterium]|nr:MFS transporter [Chloroflexota bacterium]